MLVVEVLSASTRSKDRIIKQEIYRAAGVPTYWMVDPGDLDSQPVEPRLEIYELLGDAYAREAVVTENQTYTARRPFEVTITPAEIVRG